MADQDELMQFDFGPPKKPTKKPQLGNRKRKPFGSARQEAKETQKTEEKEPQQPETTTQPPVQQKPSERPLPTQKQQPQNPPQEQPAEECDSSIKGLLQSKKFAEREKGYTDLIQWNDPSITKVDFIRDAHEYAKEKHFKVLGSLLTALETVINEPLFQQNLNFPQFFQNLLECMMSNAKGQTQQQLNTFICEFWDAWDNKDQFIEETKKHLLSKKVKIQEKSCQLILELLNGGNIKELKNLDPLFPNLLKVMDSKSPAIRKTCMSVLKEAYLWLGPSMEPQIAKLNKAQEKEFNNYKEQVSPSAMKLGQEKVKKEKTKVAEQKTTAQSQPQAQTSNKRESKLQTQQSRVSDLTSLNIKENFGEDISNQEAVEKMIDRTLFKNVHEDFSVEQVEELEDLDDVRVSLIAEKNLQIEDKNIKTQIILLHLKQILKITDDFKDMNKVQNKQLYNILNQIIQKFDVECLNQYVVTVYSVFFLEQMSSRCKEDLFKLFQALTDSKKNIISPKDLIDQIFDIIQKKDITPNKDLICSLARVIETEIVSKKDLQAIPTARLLRFVKHQKTLLQQETDIKDRIFNLMRNLQDNFNKTVLNDYPTTLIKEFEAQNKEIEKNIIKTVQKLKEKNVEKRKQALLELVDVKDYTQMQMLWENKDFQNFIKRSLITETQNEYYQKIIQIIENYLQFQRESPADFNLKNYLYVFHTIITQYYDIKEDEENYENKKRLHILQNIFKKTTDWLEPTIIFNQLINDINAQNWREQICGFFLEYQESIELEPNFMDYIIDAYQHFKQSEGEKTRSQIEKVIISLKNCKNEEIQEKGNQNRNIKKIWQQSEEQILFGEDFLEFEGVFRNKGFYNSIKKFILKALDMNESNFYSLRIDSVRIDDAKNTSTKPKLAYFYLRSNENLNQISEHILNQINSINLNKLDQVSILIIFRTLINIMKNNYYCRQDQLYTDTIETFVNLIQLNRLTMDDVEIMNLTQSERKVYQYAINYNDMQDQDDMEEGHEVAPSMIGPGMDDTYMVHDQNQTYEQNVSFNQYQPRDQVSITTPQESAFRKKYHARQDDMSQNDNYRVLDDYSQNMQSQKSYYSKQSQRNLQRMRSNNPNIDLQMELNIKLEGMLSFDMVRVEEGKAFLMKLIESQDQANVLFLASQMDSIFKVFIEMFEAIFDGGINYDVEKDSYEFIFEPIKQITSNSDFLVNLSQEMLNRMVEEVLNKLVSCNEEKILYEKAQPNKEFFEYCDFIVKYFNGIMLRLLKNVNFNKILESLFLLLFHYNNLQHNDLDKKVFDLDLLCINRVTNRMSSVVDQVDPVLVLKQIDSYETQIGINNPKNKKGSQIIKMMLRELVNNFSSEEVWQAYSDIYGNMPDQSNIVFTFINILQKNNQNKQQEQSYSDNQNQLLQLIEMINRDTNQQQLAFFEKKIFEILSNDPQINLRVYGGYFQNKQFFNYLIAKLEQLRAQPNSQQRMDDILNQSNISFLTNKSNLGKRRYKQLQNYNCNGLLIKCRKKIQTENKIKVKYLNKKLDSKYFILKKQRYFELIVHKFSIQKKWQNQRNPEKAKTKKTYFFKSKVSIYHK